jgi:outer membrane protein TolC
MFYRNIWQPSFPPRRATKRRLLVAAAASVLLMCGIAGGIALAQTDEAQIPDYSKSPDSFPAIYKPYQRQEIPRPTFQNITNPAPTATTEGGKQPLSLSQLLSSVVSNNLDIASSRYDYFMSGTDVLRTKAGEAPRGTQGARVPSGLGSGIGGGAGGFTGAANNARQLFIGPRGTLDPSLTLNFSVDTLTSPLNSSRVTGTTDITAHTTALQARYTQAFTSGTSFSFAFNTQRQSSTSRNQRFNPSFGSNFNFSVNQQLLSGFGFATNRRFMAVAETNRAVAREVFRQQVIGTVNQAMNFYWDLAAAQQRVRTAEQALAVSQQLHEDNRKQAEIGTLPPLDVVAAEAEVAARRRDLIVAQTSDQVLELRLKNLMSREMDAPLEAANMEAADPLPDPQEGDIPPFEEALATAMRNRPELHQAEGNIRNQEVAADYTKKNLKPALSIFGVLSSAGRTGELTSAWSQVRSLDFPEYAYGFSFSFPIGNRAAQADHLRAQLELRQSETSLQRTRNQIRLEVRNAIIGLQQARAQVQAARVAVERSEQTLDAEQKKLRAGISTSYNVIRVQRDLFSAQLAEVQARVSYAKARVEMDRARGTTLEQRRISLEATLADRLAGNQSTQ